MLYDHPEDIKGALRKKYGSVAAFERAKRLPALSVRDILRGKKRGRIARIVAADLGIPLTDLDIFQSGSHNRDISSGAAASHYLNEGGE